MIDEELHVRIEEVAGHGTFLALGSYRTMRHLIDLGGTWLFKAIFGPVGSDLGASPEGLPARLGQPNFEFGVIVGNQPINPLGGWLIPGESDREVVRREHATRRHE
jgi:hypothetical protein